MSQPLSEYFAQEAGEYLDHLDALLSRPDAPDPVEFFRLARGVRGSAQIAGADAVARVAEGMEDAARALRDGALAWNDDVRSRARETSADLRALVSASGRWNAADDDRARGAAARWEGTPASRRRGDADGPADQLHDFLRREIGGVVGELERALAELRANPNGREPLRAVFRRMRPVRGVAGMNTLSPVLELLEGIEDAAHEILGRSSAAASRELELLEAARAGLAAAGAALERGEGVGDTPELERFRESRDRSEGQGEGDTGVVPVASLFFDDGGPHVVSSPMAPAPGAEGAGTLAGDVDAFLRIEATGFLDRAEGLIASLSARPSRFAKIARELRDIARGVGELAVTYGITAISSAAEEAAARVAQAGSAEEARSALLRLRSSLPGSTPRAESAVDVEPDTDGGAAAPPAPAPAGDGVVPIESLVYAPADALREAVAMRERVTALASSADGDALRSAIDELFGLLTLALPAGRAAAG